MKKFSDQEWRGR